MTSATRGADSGHDSPHTSGGVDHGEYPPLGPVRRLVRETGLGLIVLGLVVLLFVAYQLLGTTLTEQHNQHLLQQSFDRALATGGSTTTPGTTTGGNAGSGGSGGSGGTPGATTSRHVPTVGPATAVPTGAALAHLVIPAINVDKYVVQGTSEADLSEGPGHYPQTVMPGQVGNTAIAGHRTTYGAPFFRLNELRKGDPIYLTVTSGKTYRYLMTSSEVVPPSDVSVLDPTTTAQLTLTTCNPRFSAATRLVVVARLAPPTATKAASRRKSAAPGASTKPGSAAATTAPGAGTTTTTTTGTAASPATASGQATSALNLGEGQRSARVPAIIFGALVVLLWILTRLAIHHTRRWKRGLAYVVGIGLCLVPLWFCFENVVRLLPPNI